MGFDNEDAWTELEGDVEVWRTALLKKCWHYCPVCDDDTLEWKDNKAKCRVCGLVVKMAGLGLAYSKALTSEEVVRLYRRYTSELKGQS